MKSVLEAVKKTQKQENRQQIETKNKKKGTGNARALLKKYRFLVLTICMIVLLSVFCAIVMNLNSSYIVVVMRFSEITQGYNPDGSPFDIYELLSDNVVNNACEKLNNRIDPVTLKKHITLSSNSVAGSFNSVQEKVMDGNDNYYYFPNRYMITYSVLSNKIKDEGFAACFQAICDSFSLPSKAEVLQAVAQAYSEEYEALHIIKEDFFTVDWEYVQSLDHFNRVSELQRIIENFSRYVNQKYDENVRYISADGIGFGELSTELSSIQNLDLQNYKAFIIQNAVTKDKESLLRQFRYVYNENSKIAERKTAEYSVMLEGIKLYDPNITKVTFIPSLDTDNAFYMNRTKIGIDYLTYNANAAKLEADEAKSTAAQYGYLEEHFSDAAPTDAGLILSAENMYENITNKINAFCKKAQELNKGYIDNVTYEQILITGVADGKDLISLCILIAKLAIFTASAMYALYCIQQFLRKMLQRLQTREKKVK